MKIPVDCAFYVYATYDNSDAECSRDDEIALLIASQLGEAIFVSDCREDKRCIMGFFPAQCWAMRAAKALEALGIEADLRDEEQGTFLLDAIYTASTQQSAFESRIAGVIATNHGEVTGATPFEDDRRCVSASFSCRSDIEQAAETLTDWGITTNRYRLEPDSPEDLQDGDFKRHFNAGWDAGYEQGRKNATADA
jgi:hypothetical protein